MKTIATSVFLLLSFAAWSQNEKYTAAMKKNLALFDSTVTTEQCQSLE
jgi:hypothetical protein